MVHVNLEIEEKNTHMDSAIKIKLSLIYQSRIVNIEWAVRVLVLTLESCLYGHLFDFIISPVQCLLPAPGQ